MDETARKRLKEARVNAGLSLRDLAAQTDISPSQLSQIERGKSEPSVSSLFKLVAALGISLDELMGGEAIDGTVKPEEMSSTQLRAEASSAKSPVIPTDTRARLVMNSGVVWERLLHQPIGGVEFLLVTYEAGGSSSTDGSLMTHNGYEFAYLISGQLKVSLGFETYLLSAGESLAFDSQSPHMFKNEGSVPAMGVWFILGKAPDSTDEESLKDEVHSAVDVLRIFSGLKM